MKIATKLYKNQPVLSPHLVLVIGVLTASTAAILIRYAQDATPPTPSLVIAALRMTIAALILTPLALRNHRPALRALSRRDLGIALLAGVLLAVHFASWITSLEYTSVLISIVLVTTNPLWVALFAPLLLGETVNRRTLIAIVVAFLGGVLISLGGGDSGEAGSNNLLGAGLATLGAITASLYFIAGRRLRASLDLIPYIWLCYGMAAIVLLIAVLLSGQSLLGYAPEAYLAMLLLAIGPQLIGHSSFNYALGHLSPTYVSLVILGEPVSSTLLAAVLFGEMPVEVQIIGAALILFAVAFARDHEPSEAASEAA